jgi:multiple sugar transport system substrate-binding protein
MKRRSVLAGALLTVLLATSACGGGDDEGGAAADGGELTFANFQWLEPNRGEALWTAVSGYTKVNGKATMKQQAITRKDYESTLKTQLGARSGPDILVIPDTFFPELADAGLLEPVGDVLDDTQKATLNKTNEAAKYKDEQLAYAWEVVNYALFWNTKLLATAGVQPPKDLRDLVAVAKEIKVKTGHPGFAVRHQINEEVPWWIDFANWPYGFGGGWSKDGKLTIDSPENLAALKAYKELYDSGAMAVGDDASTFRSKFSEGKIGMMIDNSSALFTMVNGSKTVPSATGVKASPLPFPAPASAHASFFVGINKNSKNKALAKDWLKWFLTADAQKSAAAALGASVIGTDAKPPQSFLTQNPWVPVFQAQVTNSRDAVVDGFETKTPQIRRAVLQQVERVLVQGLDPATALKNAQQEASELK